MERKRRGPAGLAPGPAAPETGAASGPGDARIDITGEVCPMTFVRTRLALEKLRRGASLHVRLRGGEPLGNVPRSARELGYRVSEPEEESPGSGIWRLSIRHGGEERENGPTR